MQMLSVSEHGSQHGVVQILATAYTQTRFNSSMVAASVSAIFSISTIVLLVSSYTISQARWLYQQDDIQMLGLLLRCCCPPYLWHAGPRLA
jgi:cytochrome c oxidase subunit 3